LYDKDTAKIRFVLLMSRWTSYPEAACCFLPWNSLPLERIEDLNDIGPCEDGVQLVKGIAPKKVLDKWRHLCKFFFNLDF
jgi:hypothetical protein